MKQFPRWAMLMVEVIYPLVDEALRHHRFFVCFWLCLFLVLEVSTRCSSVVAVGDKPVFVPRCDSKQPKARPMYVL